MIKIKLCKKAVCSFYIKAGLIVYAAMIVLISLCPLRVGFLLLFVIINIGVFITLFVCIAIKFFTSAVEFSIDESGVKAHMFGFSFGCKYDDIIGIRKKRPYTFFNMLIVKNGFPIPFPSVRLLSKEDLSRVAEVLSQYIDKEHPLYIHLGCYASKDN